MAQEEANKSRTRPRRKSCRYHQDKRTRAEDKDKRVKAKRRRPSERSARPRTWPVSSRKSRCSTEAAAAFRSCRAATRLRGLPTPATTSLPSQPLSCPPSPFRSSSNKALPSLPTRRIVSCTLNAATFLSFFHISHFLYFISSYSFLISDFPYI